MTKHTESRSITAQLQLIDGLMNSLNSSFKMILFLYKAGGYLMKAMHTMILFYAKPLTTELFRKSSLPKTRMAEISTEGRERAAKRRGMHGSGYPFLVVKLVVIFIPSPQYFLLLLPNHAMLFQARYLPIYLVCLQRQLHHD